MKSKKKIIASLREELDAMRQRAESAERKLFGEPVWVDAENEEIDFERSKYCLSSELDCDGAVFPAGTNSYLYLMDSTSRKKVIVVEVGNRNHYSSCTGWLKLDFTLPPSGDNWRDQRLVVPVRKVKAETIKED